MGDIEHGFAFEPGGSGGLELVVFLRVAPVECCDVYRTSFAADFDCNAARREPGAFVADECERFWIGVFDECEWRNVDAISGDADGGGKQFCGYERIEQ